jgi:hypothetical protein
MHGKVRIAALGAALILAATAIGCGGDTGQIGASASSSSSGTSTGTGTGGEGGGTTSSSSSGTGGEGGGTTSSSSSGTGGSGGGEPNYGPPATETVNAGGVTASPNYKMVFTLGQPTQNQTKTTSPGYQMQGGLIGANGTLP